jgi:hypothetical protein
MGGATTRPGRATWARLAPGPHLIDFLIFRASRGKILMLQKSWVNLSSGRFVELKNTQNKVFLSRGVITKIRGSMENPHKTL